MTEASEPGGDRAKPDKDIEIVVITTADDLLDVFKRKDPLRKVFDHAVALVGGKGHEENFTLEYDGQPLPLDREIDDVAAELGWGDKVELELVPKPVVV